MAIVIQEGIIIIIIIIIIISIISFIIIIIILLLLLLLVKEIQGVYKRMVRFKKLTRNLFLTLHGQNVQRQQWQLSKFLMRYQQFASHA